MTGFKNTENHFGLIAIFIHWFMVLLLVGLLALGLYMNSLPIGLRKLQLYGLHKEFGMLALMVGGLRFLWRITSVLPRLPEHMPNWEKLAARSTHWAFYGFILVMPVSGWLITSAAGIPAAFFNLFVVPNLITANKELIPTFVFIHKWVGYAFIGAICMHSAAALKHHYIDKDNVLRGMLP